mgnify:CR=1 FL=1
MELDGATREQLHGALVSSFSRSELRQLVDFKLDEDLDVIVGDQKELSDVVLKLIRWCRRHSQVKRLIEAAHKGVPSNNELKLLYEKAFPESLVIPSQTLRNKRFPEAHEFDMSGLMERCLSEIHTKRGLVGLVVPCAEEAFRVRFCERLKKELGRKDILIKQPLQLDPFIDVNDVVSRIARYKVNLNRQKDVICPVPLNIFESSTLPNSFWSLLSENFKDENLRNRLIVVMYGRKNAVFPAGPMRLEPPKFQRVHVFQWIIRISQLAGWPEPEREIWEQKMIMACTFDEQSGVLDTRQVYEHLDWSLRLLQKNISVVDFLRELEDSWS